MPKIHLLVADENFSHQTCELLKAYGHDLVTLNDLGLAQIAFPDDQVLLKATELGRCLLTFNRADFIKLHKQDDQHAGIIVCTYNRDSIQLAEKINEVIQSKESLLRQLIRIYRG